MGAYEENEWKYEIQKPTYKGIEAEEDREEWDRAKTITEANALTKNKKQCS